MLLIYWPVYTIAVLIWIRTAVAKDLSLYRLPIALKCVACGLGLLSFALECVGPEFDQKSKRAHENPVITANIFSIWVSKLDSQVCMYSYWFKAFAWMTPLMQKGASTFISEDDLPDVKPQDECAKLGLRLKDALKNQ